MTPDEQCARVLGWTYYEAQGRKPRRWYGPKSSVVHSEPPAYGSDETLLGEMLRWFINNSLGFAMECDDDHSYFRAYGTQRDWVSSGDITMCEAVRDALIQASGEVAP